MCGACYAQAYDADMSIARQIRFEPADEILDGVFLGPEGSTVELAWLQERGIDRVLTVAAHCDHLPRFDGIEYMRIDVDDDPTESLRPHFEQAFEFVRMRTGSNALVHCVSGISRSGATVIALAMAELRLGYEEALALVRARRPVVSPNSGFQRQLREFEAELRAASWHLQTSRACLDGGADEDDDACEDCEVAPIVDQKLSHMLVKAKQADALRCKLAQSLQHGLQTDTLAAAVQMQVEAKQAVALRRKQAQGLQPGLQTGAWLVR